MDTARPLRELFDELAGGGHTGRPAADALAEAGHADLPPELVGEAIVNYADTATVEVAEQLAPFVTAITAGEPPDAESGIDLLAGAAAEGIDDADLVMAADKVAAEEAPAAVTEFDLAFGTGSDAGLFDTAASGAGTSDEAAIDDWSASGAEPETTEAETTEAAVDEPAHDEAFGDPFDLDAATGGEAADGGPADG